MSLELDKIIEYTGIKAETNEQFIEQFSKKFLTEDQIFKDKEVKDRIFGRAFGGATTAVKQIFDESGIEITGDDLKQPIESVVKLGLQKINDKFEAERLELQKTAGLTADEKIKEFQDNLSKSQAKIKDLEKLAKDRALEIENTKKDFGNQLKGVKLDTTVKSVHGAIQWNPEKDEYSRKGFLTAMSEQYKIDLDENEEPFIVSRQSGERIKAEGSHSTFMTPAEVYKQEAIKAGLMAINKKAGQSNGTPPTVKKEKVEPASFMPQRKMANTSFKLGS